MSKTPKTAFVRFNHTAPVVPVLESVTLTLSKEATQTLVYILGACPYNMLGKELNTVWDALADHAVEGPFAYDCDDNPFIINGSLKNG